MLPGPVPLSLPDWSDLQEAFARAQEEARRARQMLSDWAHSEHFGRVEMLAGAGAPTRAGHLSRQAERSVGLLPESREAIADYLA